MPERYRLQCVRLPPNLYIFAFHSLMQTLEILNFSTWQKISTTFEHFMEHIYLYRGMDIQKEYSYLLLSNEQL